MNKKQAMKVLNEMLDEYGDLPFQFFFTANLFRIMLCRLSNELDSVAANWKVPIKDWNEEEKEKLAMVLFGIKQAEVKDKDSWRRK